MRSPARRRPGARRARRGARPLHLAPPRVPSWRRREWSTRSCSSVSAAARNASGRSSRPADAASRSIARSRCRVSDRRRGSAASTAGPPAEASPGARQADGAAPALEEVAYVRLAEFDPERTPGFPGAVPFGAQVDPAEDDAERHPLLRPLPHQRETRPDNAHQVPGVHAGQMVFDLAAVIADVDTRPGRPSRARSLTAQSLPDDFSGDEPACLRRRSRRSTRHRRRCRERRRATGRRDRSSWRPRRPARRARTAATRHRSTGGRPPTAVRWRRRSRRGSRRRSRARSTSGRARLRATSRGRRSSGG